jgi:heme a synthase
VETPQATIAKRAEPLVGWWLVAICVCVFAMVMVGGATRLTDSGLSITEWDLGKGLTPPLSAQRWNEEFALYQQTTEYQVQNRGMSLGEFQSIYWWEWAHRFLGKMIGLVFALPFAFFWATGRLKGRFLPVFGLFALGGLQGAIGWWMVTSGLVGRLDVSPIRLAVHLGLAFLILGGGIWMALDAFAWPHKRGQLGAPRGLLWAFLSLLFLQVIFGALLAGADGGPAYGDWPTIGGRWIPPFYAALDPFWRNFTENHAAQHLHHRTLGYVVALFALALAACALFRGEGASRNAALRLGAVAFFQAALGIVVVLTAAPLGMSLVHQAGAALLWGVGVVTLRATR